MTLEEIDERYRDAALGDDGESWDDDKDASEPGWDDPAELSEDDEDDEES